MNIPCVAVLRDVTVEAEDKPARTILVLEGVSDC
jgi:hypothetical protein